MKASRSALLGLVVIVILISAANTWWVGRQHRELGREVASLAGDGAIRMLSSETCATCMFARAWLKEHEVPFSECKIERDAQCRADYERLESPGTPVMLVRGQPQLGFDPHRLREGLMRRS